MQKLLRIVFIFENKNSGSIKNAIIHWTHIFTGEVYIF